MTGISDNLAAVQRLISAWEAIDGDAVARCFAEDGVWHNMPYAPIAGREAVRLAVSRFLAGMTEVRFEVRHAGEIAQGVVMNERIDTFRRADGTELRFPATGVFELRNGLIAIWRDYFDSAVMTVPS